MPGNWSIQNYCYFSTESIATTIIIFKRRQQPGVKSDNNTSASPKYQPFGSCLFHFTKNSVFVEHGQKWCCTWLQSIVAQPENVVGTRLHVMDKFRYKSGDTIVFLPFLFVKKYIILLKPDLPVHFVLHCALDDQPLFFAVQGMLKIECSTGDWHLINM